MTALELPPAATARSTLSSIFPDSSSSEASASSTAKVAELACAGLFTADEVAASETTAVALRNCPAAKVGSTSARKLPHCVTTPRTAREGPKP